MTTNTLTYSSELMRNYKQAQILAPDADFQALQTANGLSLLFSISSDGALYLTQELPEQSTGWQRQDFSAAQVAKDFAGKTGIRVTHFAGAQAPSSGNIDLAMVVRSGAQDQLYLSLANSATDTSWTTQPSWTAFPFDDPNHPLAKLRIVEVFISEAADAEYIVVDVLRDPDSPEPLLFRYYIDPAKSGGYAWHPHDLSIDLDANRYSSCLGRQSGQTIDGLYTAGSVNGSAQLVYQPLYNVWDPAIPAPPARLTLPGNKVPDALASCRNTDESTDLYVASQGALYYFASGNQKDGAQGVQLASGLMFNGVTKLYAYTSRGKIVVWGLNGSDQAFYISCAAGQQLAKGAWSVPVPIVTGVDLISPYVNRADSGNTFFAAGGDELYKLVQSTDTTLWTKQQITLPPPSARTPAQKFSSYTTRLQLLDSSQQPVAGQPLLLSTKSRTAFYINHLYYVLDSTPISVPTDSAGSITLIECVENLTATRLSVSDGAGNSIEIDPMQKPLNKIAQLDSVSGLQGARITSPNGSTRPLVAPGTSSDLLKTVASSNQALGKAYTQLSSPESAAARAKLRAAGARPVALAAIAPSDIGNDIVVAAGDLFSWLESGVESVVQVIEDAASDTWHFIATIAGEVYRCALDTVEAVAGAVQWVFNAIKTGIDDLIAFLEFLFEWQDITRTQRVLTNLSKLWLSQQVDEILVIKSQFDGMITTAQNAINGWAGIGDWSGLGSAAANPLDASSTPAAQLSAPSTLLSSHFQSNANNLVQPKPPAPPEPSSNPIQVLLQALQSEGQVLDQVLTQLESLATDWNTLSLTQVLQRIVGIIADGVLGSARVVVDALLDILYDVAKTALAVLATPIHIPVVSDILADFGVPSLSMLDLFGYIAAVPVTIGYKLAHGSTPFPDNADTNLLISATSLAQLQGAAAPSVVAAAFATRSDVRGALAAAPAALAAAAPAPAGGLLSLSPAAANAVFVAGHAAAGFFTLMSCFVDPFEAAEDSGDNPWGIPSAILAILAGASVGAAVVLAPQDPIKNTAVNWINRVTLGIRILAKLIFSGPAQAKFDASTGIMNKLKADDGRATGAIVDAVLVIPALACTCWHFYELSEDDAGERRSNAIIEETANLTSYISRVSYTTAVNTEGDVKAVAIGVMVVANVAYAGLETAEAVIGRA